MAMAAADADAAAAAVCLVPRYVRYPYVLEKIAFLSRSLESCCCIHSFLVSGSTSCIRLTRGGPGSRSCSLSDQGKSDSITSGLVAFGFMSSAGKCYLSLISPPILNFDTTCTCIWRVRARVARKGKKDVRRMK